MTEKSYTVTASLFDAFPLPIDHARRQQPTAFDGRRVQRGRHQAARGWQLYACVKGAYNAFRIGIPDAFGNVRKEQAGAAVHLVRLPIRTKRMADYFTFFNTVRYQ